MRRALVLLAVSVSLAAAITDVEDVDMSEDSVVSLSDGPPSGEVRPTKNDERPNAGAALGTKGSFVLEHASAAPKLNLLELGEEDESRLSLAEAAKILRTVAGAAGSKATVSRRELDAMIQKATKPKGDKMLGEAGVVGAVHEGDLGEGMDLADAGFRYTNGLFGDKGGKKPWLKCESDCKGTGYGGYGFCYTKGMGRPWGGCMAPGATPAIEAPPQLYSKNRITTVGQPRAHLYCDTRSGGNIWMRSGGQLVAGCTKCVSDDYFLVPNHHVESMMVGTCFSINQYQPWNAAVLKSQGGEQRAMKCSVFTNGKGMRSKYFGGVDADKWDSAPKSSPYNPRAFLCSSAAKFSDHTVSGALKDKFREMRVFSAVVAKFVMCYSHNVQAGGMTCVKKTRIGKCSSFNIRNAAFDSNAFHLKSGSNGTETSTGWDKAALKLGSEKLLVGSSTAELGMHACDGAWRERILAVHQ